MTDDGTTEKTLLNELNRLHDELGVPPRTVDMGKHGRFSPALYAERWGSWEGALKAAGIDGDPGRPPKEAVVEDITETERTEEDSEDNGGEEAEHSDENLRAIRRCNERVEGTPRPEDLRERGHSVNEVLDEYGTWKDALEAAGLETEYIDPSPDHGGRNTGRKEELFEELRRYAKLHGEKPSAEDLRTADWTASPEEYREVFGTVEEAVAEGFVEDDGGEDEDELVGEIKRYYLRKGAAPDAEDVRSTDWMSSVEGYREAFGSVRQAVEHAGIDG
jgi:hypothetical protein